MSALKEQLNKELHDMRGALATLMILPHQIGTPINDATIAETTRQTAKDKIQTIRDSVERIDAMLRAASGM